MSTPRFFAPEDNSQEYRIGEDVTVHVDVETLHHANRVLRLRVGEPIEVVLRNTWQAYRGEITYLSAKGLVIKVTGKLQTETPSITFDLFWGYAKAGKNETIVRQAVEIGCARLIPVLFERSEVRFDKEVLERKTKRLRAIAQSAAMQAHRDRVPAIDDIYLFADAIERLENYDAVIVAWEEAEIGPLSRVVDDALSHISNNDKASLALVVGPEGGIATGEIEKLCAAGASISSMGCSILRVETACAVACGITADRIRVVTDTPLDAR